MEGGTDCRETKRGKESRDKYRENETVNRAMTDAKGTSREGWYIEISLGRPHRDSQSGTDGQTDRQGPLSWTMSLSNPTRRHS